MALRPTANLKEASLAVGARRQTGEAGHGAASSNTTAMFTNTHDLQFVNSNLNVAGGDIHNHNAHYYYERKRDIWAILQAVPNFRDIYLDMLEKATRGTGMWLVKSDKFRVWLEPNGGIKIYWGSGIPGAGKTVLASIVIQYLEELRKESSGPICICYVYFRYSQREEVTVRDVLETFVKQTLERHPDCQSLIERTYAQHLKEGSQPTVAQLQGLLRELADQMACTFYILDALDEAPTKIQLVVVKTLSSLKAKLFITSRPLETVHAKFPGAHITPIFAQDTDLVLHIDESIDKSADLQHLLDQEGPSLKEEIVSTIKQNCGGMFLHASLQLDALCECITALDVRRELKAFPSRIEDVYLYTWDRILKQKAEHVSLAKAALLWVLNAARSMTVEELRRAVATSPDTHKFQSDRVVPASTLISLTRGLIVVEEESRLVRLVHYTAKDILKGLLRDSFPHPHSHLAAVCMTHLAECNFQNTTISSEEEFKSVLKEDPLLAYASEAWALHACAELHVPETKHQTAEFIKESHAFPALIYDGLWGFDILTPLHIISLYKLPMLLIEGTLMKSPNLTTKLHQKTPLRLAAQSGHDSLVAGLIALPEAQVNSVDSFARSALMEAANAGHYGVVKLLLAHSGIQVNLADGDGWSALMYAASWGQEGTVKLLLAHPEIQVNSVNSRGLSALMMAAIKCSEGVVKVLLAYPGIQANLLNDNGCSALMRAASDGYEGIVKLLLAAPGIQVNLVDDRGRSALMHTANIGHEGVTRLLFAYPGIQVNLVNRRGWSALMVAANDGHEGFVKLLLAFPGIQINQADDHGSTPLLLAAEHGRTAIVNLLLTTGAFDINAFDKDGDTAIKMAAHNGHEAVVRMLLDAPDVDIAIRSTTDGYTAMSGAQANDHHAIVELLRDFESRRTIGSSPIENTDDEAFDSDSEAYYDAEEGEAEDASLGSPIPS